VKGAVKAAPFLLLQPAWPQRRAVAARALIPDLALLIRAAESVRHQTEVPCGGAEKVDLIPGAAPARDLGERRKQPGGAGKAIARAEIALVGMMLILSSGTLAVPSTVEHHKLNAAVLLSSIAIIGIRFDPGSGSASRKSAPPKGNEESLAAAGTSVLRAKANATKANKRQRPKRRGQDIVGLKFPGKADGKTRRPRAR
jgi:hypothetical protein